MQADARSDDQPVLAGRTVGVTADRRGDDQIVMFGRLGADVVLAPTLATVKLPDPDRLRRITEDLVSDPPDIVVANTGIGMRTWLEAAGGWGLGDALTEALGSSRIAVRGPKAAAVLSSSGLTAWWRSPSEQLADLVAHLEATGVAGRRVAFQLHGDAAAEPIARLESAGATVVPVPVYLWKPPPDPAPALHLVDLVCAGRVDAVTFTAGPQIRSLLDLAEGVGRRDELVSALDSDRVVVGCIGPVCAGVAVECGITGPVVPAAWRLGSLVKAVTAALTAG